MWVPPKPGGEAAGCVGRSRGGQSREYRPPGDSPGGLCRPVAPAARRSRGHPLRGGYRNVTEVPPLGIGADTSWMLPGISDSQDLGSDPQSGAAPPLAPISPHPMESVCSIQDPSPLPSQL